MYVLRAIGRLAQRYQMLSLMLALFVVGSVASDYFLTVENLRNIIKQVSVIGISAVGGTMVIISAGIDLSVGSVIALVGVVIALLQALPVPLVLLIALAVGTLLGLANGALNSYIRLPAFITTLGTGGIAAGLALAWSGGWPLFITNRGFAPIGQGSILGIPTCPLVFLAVAIVGHIILTRTPFGVYVYGLGNNEEALRLAGINTRRNRTFIFVLAGFLAALSGIVAASRSMTGDPSIGSQLSFDVISAVVIGGTRIEGGYGGIVEAVIGTMMIGILNNVMNLTGVSTYYQMLFKGAIIVVAVLTARADLPRLLGSLVGRRRARGNVEA